MRVPRLSPAHLALLGTSMAWSLSTSAAFAQLAPPPPMQSGGLAPPPKESGPPPVLPPAPNNTQLALEAAQHEDSGRGLEFVYFTAEGGFEFASLAAITQSGTLVPNGTDTSAIGPLVGVSSGLRLLYFTLGPRFRYAHMTSWDIWTLNLDIGWRVPLGKLEPHGEIGAGYAKLGRSADDVLGAGRGISVSGFDFRLGAGFDYYPTSVFSVGAVLDLELLRLARSSIALQPGDPPSVASFYTNASSLGLAVTTSVVIGFHF